MRTVGVVDSDSDSDNNSDDEDEETYTCLACKLVLSTNDSSLSSNEVAEQWKSHIRSREHITKTRLYIKTLNSSRPPPQLVHQPESFFCQCCLKVLKHHSGWSRHIKCRSHLRNLAVASQ